MSAFMIVDVDIKDMDIYRKYMEQVKPLIEKFGGKYLVRGGELDVLEGSWSPTRIVLVEFKDIDTIRAFFDSPEYEPLKQIRRSCSTIDVTAVEGM